MEEKNTIAITMKVLGTCFGIVLALAGIFFSIAIWLIPLNPKLFVLGAAIHLFGVIILGVIDYLNNGIEKRAVKQQKLEEKLAQNQLKCSEHAARQSAETNERIAKQNAEIQERIARQTKIRKD